MRSGVFTFCVWMCAARAEIAVMGCPPGTPCWPWHLNSQPVLTTHHLSLHQVPDHPVLMQNWDPISRTDPYVQQRLVVRQQQWTWPLAQRAAHGSEPVLQQQPARLVYEKEAASMLSGQTYQTAPHDRPIDCTPTQTIPQQVARPQASQISSEGYQGIAGSLPHNNFNPKPPGRESPIVHRHIVYTNPTQAIPRPDIRPDQRPAYLTIQPSFGQKTSSSPITETPPVSKYLCEILKRDRTHKINSTSSPAPPLNPSPGGSLSATYHASKFPRKPSVKMPPISRPTSARPPLKQPLPTTGQKAPTPPTKQEANGISPSVNACQRYRNEAMRFLENQVRIHRGEFAGKGEFPYMVAIGYVNDEKVTWACGGSLISERYVITAAHCVQSSACIPDPREAMVLRMGEKRLDEGAARRRPEDFRAEELLQHAAYKLPEVYHDVALVRINRPVRFSADVRPACLPAPGFPPAPGARWTTAGWGGDGLLGEIAFQGALKKAEMIELEEKNCPIEGKSRVPAGLGSRMLCTQHFHNNACDGDSGGPLVQQDINGQDVLVGVFSSSGNPCSGNKTALFVRISSELDWIEKIVWPK